MKKNPQIERLEWENGKLREQIKRMREDPPDYPFLACDHSCCLATPRGMSTNGGCRCDETKLRNAVTHLRTRMHFLMATIQELRDGYLPEDTYGPTAERLIGHDRPPGGWRIQGKS